MTAAVIATSSLSIKSTHVNEINTFSSQFTGQRGSKKSPTILTLYGTVFQQVFRGTAGVRERQAGVPVKNKNKAKIIVSRTVYFEARGGVR